MSDPTPHTHVCVGMFRPRLEECYPLAKSGFCPACRAMLWTSMGPPGCIHDHWLRGHFDTPVYKHVDEIQVPTS